MISNSDLILKNLYFIKTDIVNRPGAFFILLKFVHNLFHDIPNALLIPKTAWKQKP